MMRSKDFLEDISLTPQIGEVIEDYGRKVKSVLSLMHHRGVKGIANLVNLREIAKRDGEIKITFVVTLEDIDNFIDGKRDDIKTWIYCE